MIRSMTGFGSGRAEGDGFTVSVEIRAVNGRFLDVRAKLPANLNALEEVLRRKIQKSCQRGNISITMLVQRDPTARNGSAKFDRQMFETYEAVLDTIDREYGKKIDIADVIDIKDIILDEETASVDERATLMAVDDAIRQLQGMRVREGRAIAADLRSRVEKLHTLLEAIQSIWENALAEMKNHYEERIRTLMGETPLDDSRILQEAAILSDKLDIMEECVRCNSHLEQLSALLDEDEPVGKRMNFLLQEVVREINTIGSKTNELEIIQRVVDMKDEAEKIKEQVQNVL